MTSRQIFIGVIALITCGFLLLFWSPAQAQSPPPSTVTYTWSYSKLGEHERVCKQVATQLLRPASPGLDRQPVRVKSRIVDPHWCQSPPTDP